MGGREGRGERDGGNDTTIHTCTVDIMLENYMYMLFTTCMYIAMYMYTCTS